MVIVSRHGSEGELLRMRRAIEGLPEHLRADVAELFADSKSGVHLVELRRLENAEAIAGSLWRLRSYLGVFYGGKRVCEARA